MRRTFTVRVTFKGFSRDYVFDLDTMKTALTGTPMETLSRQIGEMAAAAAATMKARTYEELSPYMPRWEVVK